MGVSPIRVVAVLLLSASVAYGSYQIIKPQIFSYVKLRDGITVEAGSLLKQEYIERAEIALGGLFTTQTAPMEGLISWTEVRKFIGLPLVRRISGSVPLFVSDIDAEGEGTIDRELSETKTGMSIPVDNILGVYPHLSVGDRVHLYASFEDEEGAHSGLLLRDMPVISLQRQLEGDEPQLHAVTIALKLNEAVLLTHALHYGKIHLGKAAPVEGKEGGVGDIAFANALMKTKKRWSDGEEARP